MNWILSLLFLLPGPTDLKATLKPIREKHDLPAMAGAIIQGDQLIAIGVDGVRRKRHDEPVTQDDLWHLGSCTKSMTATLIGILVDEGKLSWNTTIGEAFGSKLGDRLHNKWKSVTLEQLLNNRSGAPNKLDRDDLWGKLWERKGTPMDQRWQLVEGVLKNEPEVEPGTQYIYSNAGFSIAGAIAEQTLKTPWEELIRKKLFEPLGMKSVGFGPPGSANPVDQPRAHTAKGTPVEPGVAADNPAAIGPAGIVHCSISDWGKYISFHLTGGSKKTSLLKPDTFQKLHTPAEGPGEKYGMGWIFTERPWGEGTVYTHSGSNTMWFCTVWISPKKNFAVLVCTNQGGDEAAKACDEAAWALIQEFQKLQKAK